MNRYTLGLSLALIALSGTSYEVAAGEGRYVPKTERGRAAGDIVKKWAGYVHTVYGTSPQRWAGSMQGTFAEASTANLKAAASKQTYEAMMATLLGQRLDDEQVIDSMAKSDGSLAAIKSLGSSAEDLVYTMVTPCRILDTRNAVGRITGGLVRDFAVHTANFSGQGGNASDCGIPSDPSAVAINVVAVTPDQGGFMTIYPSGTVRPNAASLNYTAGGIIANAIIAKTTVGQPADLSIYSQYSTDVVIDIVGYFMAPEATPLSCTSVEGTSTSISAGAVTNVFAPSCPSGYTRTEVQCRPASFELVQVGSWDGHCNYKNPSGVALSANAASRCCRIPGR
jgi:hypothetical protein